jgi:hypothetical protein
MAEYNPRFKIIVISSTNTQLTGKTLATREPNP